MNNKIHRFLVKMNEALEARGRRWTTKDASLKKMEYKLYLLGQKEGAARVYEDPNVPVFKNYRRLKDFQLESLNWMIQNWHEDRNCILADEMGLGKTIQTISFLSHLRSYEGVIGPFLVLAPLTTLGQWRREIEEWTDFNCLLYYDEEGAKAKEKIQDYEFFYYHTTKVGEMKPSKMIKFQVLLTNYESFVQEL
jgi:SNF2 family DNA or RNA helicase